MSPRTSVQFERMREEKKALIMDVALEHFAGNGYHATTISHIAKHAGISKGLMYNYFSGKEELLAAIVSRSATAILENLDIDRDGSLSPAEFEYFIRQAAVILRSNRRFWQLFFQLILQKEVREQLLGSLPHKKTGHKKEDERDGEITTEELKKIILSYFTGQGVLKGPGYDPILEMNFFLLIMQGFALHYIYTETGDGAYFDKTVDKIVTFFK